MEIIKKYANRKLYHTNQKQYITLEGIAHLIQAGKTVQVIDNETGADITASILGQVAFQSPTKGGVALPIALLTNIIQLGGGTITNVRRFISTLTGGQDEIKAEIERRFDQLVAEGALNAEEAKRLQHLLLRRDFSQNPWNDFPNVEAFLPSSSDVARLQAQIDRLAIEVERLIQRKPFPPE